MDEPEKSQIIYDDSCKLCNSAVQFLKTREGSSGMVFIPATGPESEQLLSQYKIPKDLTNKTVILIAGQKVYTKSAAIIKALQKKGGWWRLTGILRLVPPLLRDAVYDMIAGNRGK